MAEINGGSIHFEATMGKGELEKSIRAAKQDILEFSTSSINSAEAMDAAFANVSKTLTNLLGVAGATGFVKKMFDVRSEMENTEASFRVFLGTAEAAANFMEQLKDAAYWNVFEFKDLAKQSAQLLAYKTNVEDVIPTLNKLSEIAAGTNAPLEGLVAAFNKVKANDTLDARAIMSFGSMGIDIPQVLADMESATKGYKVLRSEVDTSRLSFEDLQKVIDHVATGEGMFSGMMLEKMKTLGDTLGLMEDNITNMFNELGESTHGAMKTIMDFGNYLLENYKDVGTALAALVTAFGVYKASLIAVNLLENEATGVKFIDKLKQEYDTMQMKLGVMNDIKLAELEEKARNAEKISQLDELLAKSNEQVQRAQEVYEAKVAQASAVDASTSAEEAEQRITEMKAAAEELAAVSAQSEAIAEERNAIATGKATVTKEGNVVVTKQQTDANVKEAWTKRLATQATNLYTAAQEKLNATLRKNPVGLVLAALITLAGIIAIVIKRTKAHREEQEQARRAMSEYTKEVSEQTQRLKLAAQAINDHDKASALHKAGMKELNQICKEYNVTLYNESTGVEGLTQKYKQLEKAIQSATAAKMKEKLTSQINEEEQNAYDEAMDRVLDSKFFKNQTAAMTSYLQKKMQAEAQKLATGDISQLEATKEVMDYIKEQTGEELKGDDYTKVYRSISQGLYQMKNAAEDASAALADVDNNFNGYINSFQDSETATQTNAEKIAKWKQELAEAQKELRGLLVANKEWAEDEDSKKVIEDARNSEKELVEKIRAHGGMAKTLDEQKKGYQAALRDETAILYQEKENQIALMQDGYNKEDAARNLAYDKQINALKNRLKTEKELTTKERESINRQIAQQEELKTQAQEKAMRERAARLIALQQEADDAEAALNDSSAENQRKALVTKYERDIAAIDKVLSNMPSDGNRIEAENKEYAELLRRKKAIEAKYQQDNETLTSNLVIREKSAANELLAIHKSVTEMRYGDTKEGLAKIYELEMQQLENERTIALEKNKLLDEDLQQSEELINSQFDAKLTKLFLDFEKASGGFGGIFNDLSNKTRSQLKDAENYIKQVIAVVKNESDNLPEGMTEEMLQKLRETPGALQELYNRLAEVQEETYSGMGIPYEGIVLGMKKIGDAQKRYEEAQSEFAENSKERAEAEEQYTHSRLQGLQMIAEGAAEAAEQLGQIGSALSEIGATTGNKTLEEIGKALESMNGTINAIAQGFATGGPVGAMIAGATSVISNFVRQIQEDIARQDEIEKEILKTAEAFEQLKYSATEVKNIFGTDLFATLNEASGRMAGIADKLSSQFNLDISDLSLDQLDDIIAKYEVLVDSGLYEDEDLEILQQILDYLNLYRDNLDLMQSQVESIASTLGNSAVDAIFRAAESGNNMWADFEKTGSDVIKTLAKQWIQTNFLKRIFDENNEAITEAMKSGDSTQILEVVRSLMGDLESGASGAVEFLRALDSEAKAYNLSFLSDSANAASGAIKTITEESAHLIAGQMNAIRVDVRTQLDIQRGISSTLSAIKADTAFIRIIDNRLGNIERAYLGNNYAPALNRSLVR